MDKKLNILSLFDGISCGAMALSKAGLTVDNYFSFEINEKAIIIAGYNHGAYELSKRFYSFGDILHATPNILKSLGEIDIFFCGSPCQSWSKAGNKKGVGDKRGKLFEDAVDIFRQVKPKYFLFENVVMKDEWLQYMDQKIGVKHFILDSAAVSGQSRKRAYWTNIPFSKEEFDVLNYSITLEDCLLPLEEVKALELSDKASSYMLRQVADGRNHYDFKHHSQSDSPKSKCVVANWKKGVPYNVLVDGRGRSLLVRHFDPQEAEMLQGLPVGYTAGINKTARFEAIGNGWQVDTIAEILKGINCN